MSVAANTKGEVPKQTAVPPTNLLSETKPENQSVVKQGEKKEPELVQKDAPKADKKEEKSNSTTEIKAQNQKEEENKLTEATNKKELDSSPLVSLTSSELKNDTSQKIVDNKTSSNVEDIKQEEKNTESIDTKDSAEIKVSTEVPRNISNKVQKNIAEPPVSEEQPNAAPQNAVSEETPTVPDVSPSQLNTSGEETTPDLPTPSADQSKVVLDKKASEPPSPPNEISKEKTSESTVTTKKSDISDSTNKTESAVDTEPANIDEEEDACINLQELTDHVMNILNEGIANDSTNQQELLKKNIELQQFIVKLIHLLKEKTDLCANLDRQNCALTAQAKSLKDVIAITKDLLNIRNMEVERLHSDMDGMESRIKEERNRNSTAVQHLSEAMGLNDKLKAEYLTQMDLFQKLRDKYTEKVVLLTRENIKMKSLIEEHGIDMSLLINGTTEPKPEENKPEAAEN